MSTADTSKKWNLGIVGCGRIVEEAHAPALMSLSDRARIAALADPSAERRQSVIDLIGADDVAEFGDWNRMLEAGGLDAVVIAVPHHLHARAIADVAAAGLDIISEKPLANTLDEVDEIERAVTTAGVRLSVMHNWMFTSSQRSALDAIEAGRIGQPYLVRNESIWGVPWASKDPTGNWRLQANRAGGGIVIDSAYHPIYVAEAEMMSPIVRVYAAFGRTEPQSVESLATIVLEHANGGTTTIQRCWTALGGGAGAHEIHGTSGSIRFRQIDPLLMNRIFAGAGPAAPSQPQNGSAQPAPVELFEAGVGEWRPLETPVAPWWDGIRAIFEKTFDAWSENRPAPIGLAQARRALELVKAIYVSAERHSSIEVAEVAGIR